MKLDPESLRNQSFAQTTANEDDVACEFGLLKGVVRQLLCNREGFRWKKAEFVVEVAAYFCNGFSDVGDHGSC